jgi:lysophosphatidate acyltransferase
MRLPPLVLVFVSMLALSSTSNRTLNFLAPLMPALVLAAPFSPRLRYWLRLAGYVAGLGLTSIWGVTVAVAMSLVGRKQDVNFVVARSFYYSVGTLIGVRFKVEGTEHLEAHTPCVYVGNHQVSCFLFIKLSRPVPCITDSVASSQSMIDILYLGAVFPRSCSIMAKKELKYTPLLGQYIAFGNNVFVDRSSREDAVRTLGKVADTMKSKGVGLFVFVEGTRSASDQPTLLPFKKGAFHLAVQGQVPIVPIVGFLILLQALPL